MDDVIYRQDAIDALNKMKIYRPLDSDRYVISDCLNKIVNLPSADVQPVRHGRWIRHTEQKNIFNGKTIECSECGEKYVVQYIEDEKFCRNCGARMDGEQDG